MTTNKNNAIYLFTIVLCVFFIITQKILADTFTSNRIDPTKPILDFPNDYKLQGIFLGETHKYCIINNHILEIGSKMSDIQITSIDSEGVYIETSTKDRFKLDVSN